MKVRHVGIILDGNRRFAKKLMMQPWKGHELGMGKFKDLFKWIKEIEIPEMTLYCFSMQNFNRPKPEFDFLMNIFEKSAKEALENEDVYNHRIKITPIGRWHLFPDSVVKALKQLQEKTKNHEGYKINLALAYGGQEEIVDAVKKISKQIEQGNIDDQDITKELIEQNLYNASQPDFIIRTGGDHRTSNFLVWQSHYSEWFFLEKTWPEFQKEDLLNVMNEFSNRERRFGK
jgi:tritrans,polycis-undecaprenyl-diphosphate synthase [geranylgeranyl-diphosphate specific]